MTDTTSRYAKWMCNEYEPGLASVIVPTYNRARFLIEALDSVFQPTYRPIGLMVIDDGSTDDTAEVVAEWDKQYGQKEGFRFRYADVRPGEKQQCILPTQPAVGSRSG